MIHELPPLPYPRNALEPVMSAETVEYHYGKHHKGYVDKLNHLIVGTEFENVPLEEVVRHAHGAIFNNAAQVWNHTLFWNSMKPFGGPAGPNGELKKAIERNYGTIENLKAEFLEEGFAHFASGWVWLVRDTRGELQVETTHDAGNPLRGGLSPILVCDLWEHAYYIDYRNDRKRFLEGVFGILNWDAASRSFAEYESDQVAA
jgi:Fe-Mn family superoxide dismutase